MTASYGSTPERYEYPDAAGYSDGMGTLDEGTAFSSARLPASEEIIAEFGQFLDGDDRDA